MIEIEPQQILPAESSFGIRDALTRNGRVGPARKGRRVFWTCAEENTLRAVYSHGLAAAMEALPGRSASAIYKHAHGLGLRTIDAPGPRRRRHWTHTPEMDAAIVSAYGKVERKGHIVALAARLGRPVHYVTQRALALGLVPPRFKQPRWTHAENDLIASAAHLSLSGLRLRLRRAGFTRSEAAIKSQLKRLQVSRVDENRCSAAGLAQRDVDGHFAQEGRADLLGHRPRSAPTEDGDGRAGGRIGMLARVDDAGLEAVLLVVSAHGGLRPVSCEDSSGGRSG